MCPSADRRPSTLQLPESKIPKLIQSFLFSCAPSNRDFQFPSIFFELISALGNQRSVLSSTTVLWLQVMGISPFADADTRLQTIFACRSEVNAAIDAAVAGFACCSERCWKAAVHVRKKIRADRGRQIFCAIKQWKHGCGCGAERAVARDVIGEGRCHNERHPVQSWFGEGNRSHGTPEVKLIFRTPGANVGIGHGYV